MGNCINIWVKTIPHSIISLSKQKVGNFKLIESKSKDQYSNTKRSITVSNFMTNWKSIFEYLCADSTNQRIIWKKFSVQNWNVSFVWKKVRKLTDMWKGLTSDLLALTVTDHCLLCLIIDHFLLEYTLSHIDDLLNACSVHECRLRASLYCDLQQSDYSQRETTLAQVPRVICLGLNIRSDRPIM